MIATIVFAFVGAAAVGGLWLAGKTAAVGPFACAGYEFERREWAGLGPRKRQDEVKLMTRCDHLNGKTRKQVRADLGDPDSDRSDSREWRFFLGGATEYVRLGDSAHLIVRFNRSGRVARAVLPGRSD